MTATNQFAALITANRAVVYGTVVRWLIHDLRNPMQTLSLITELMGDSVSGSETDLHTSLREATQQLTGCVETLDRTLRLMPATAALEPVALSDITGALAGVLRSYRSARVEIAQATIETMPAVAGTQAFLEHALLNLVMNAIEALGERDGGRIVVSAAAVDGHVEVTVEDNGPGVAPQVQQRLFEPFVSTKPPSAYPTGLGLVVARDLLQQMNSTVSYLPKAEPGARFVIRLRPWVRL